MERTFRKLLEEIYPRKIFANQLITVDDFEQFKKQLIDELVTALKSQINLIPKKWLKSHEVRRLLKILPGTFTNIEIFRCYPLYKNWRSTFL